MADTFRDFLNVLGFAELSDEIRAAALGLDTGQEHALRVVGLLEKPDPEQIKKLAVEQKADLIISYYPLPEILLTEAESSEDELKTILEREHCSLLYLEPVFQNTRSGPANYLAKKILLQNLQSYPIPRMTDLSANVKFVVFVPTDHAPTIIEAIDQGGGGIIGNYHFCAFCSVGYGTFLPREGAKPWQGQTGKLEQAEEVRVESVVPRSQIDHVFRAVRAAHPYDEMAYDIYPLEEFIETNEGEILQGQLPQPQSVADLLSDLQQSFGANKVRLHGQDSPQNKINKIAICLGVAWEVALDMLEETSSDLLLVDDLPPSVEPFIWQIQRPVIQLSYAALRTFIFNNFCQSLQELEQWQGIDFKKSD